MLRLVRRTANSCHRCLLKDIEEMKSMPWDVIVLDERHASKSFAQKMYPVLHELTPRQRVSMRESSGDINAEQLLAWAAFLRPSRYKVCFLSQPPASVTLYSKALCLICTPDFIWPYMCPCAAPGSPSFNTVPLMVVITHHCMRLRGGSM